MSGSTDKDSLSSRLSEVRQRILQRSAATLHEVETLLEAAERGELESAERERAYLVIHNLAGVAGSVGLTEVGVASKSLDQLLRPWLRGEAPAPTWRPDLAHLVAACEAARKPGASDA